MTVHPDWSLATAVTEANDIALIRLPKAATTVIQDPDNYVLPACVRWNRDIPIASKTQNLVIGWGRTNNDIYDFGNRSTVGAFSTILQKLEVPVYSGEYCVHKYSAFSQIHKDKQICAGGERGKVLQGSRPKGFQFHHANFTPKTNPSSAYSEQ